MSHLLFFLSTIIIINPINIKLNGNFILGIDQYVFFSYCKDDADETIECDIMFFNYNDNKIDIFSTGLSIFDFERYDKNTFLFSDGNLIYSYNTKGLSKTLLYTNNNVKNNHVCDIIVYKECVYFFQSSYDIKGNKMHLYRLKDNVPKLIATFTFSEYEFHGLTSYAVGGDMYFVVGQNFYRMNSNHTICLIDNKVYELYVSKDNLIYGKYTASNKYNYFIYNTNNKKNRELVLPFSVDYQKNKMVCINNRVYFINQNEIFNLLDNDKWRKVETVFLFENKKQIFRLNSKNEVIVTIKL